MTLPVSLSSDIRILDDLLALNLNISLWSARKKLTLEDFGNVELPPEDLASLGSKRICDPERLRVFGTLKARAFNFLDRHGVRFLGGWAVPEDKAGEIVRELKSIRDEFTAQKAAFLTEYDRIIDDWIDRHAAWAKIITHSTVSGDYVRSRLGFTWQLYRVAPPVLVREQHQEQEAVMHAGLAEEVENLGRTLFSETARDADDTWRRVYAGKTEVTHKALSPLRTLRDKLKGLSFVEPHVAPVVDILDMAFSRMPKKGNIRGADLLLLQGVVCLLRDPAVLVEHSRKVMAGYGPATVLDALLHNPPLPQTLAVPEGKGDSSVQENDFATALPVLSDDDIPDFPIAELPPLVNIPSMGLW